MARSAIRPLWTCSAGSSPSRSPRRSRAAGTPATARCCAGDPGVPAHRVHRTKVATAASCGEAAVTDDKTQVETDELRAWSRGAHDRGDRMAAVADSVAGIDL